MKYHATAIVTLVIAASMQHSFVDAWGGLFNRFTPEMLSNLGYGGHGGYLNRQSYLQVKNFQKKKKKINYFKIFNVEIPRKLVSHKSESRPSHYRCHYNSALNETATSFAQLSWYTALHADRQQRGIDIMFGIFFFFKFFFRPHNCCKKQPLVSMLVYEPRFWEVKSDQGKEK